jgi:hypothetical protein
LCLALVGKRDDDQEDEHNEGDRFRIGPFPAEIPVEVEMHRTALLFSLPKRIKQIRLGCRRFNSVSAMHEAQQQFGCAAFLAIQFVSLKSAEVNGMAPLGCRHPVTGTGLEPAKLI